MATIAETAPSIGGRARPSLWTAVSAFRSLAWLSRAANQPDGVDDELLVELPFRQAPLTDQLERSILIRTIGNI